MKDQEKETRILDVHRHSYCTGVGGTVITTGLDSSSGGTLEGDGVE
jgi:hypothetical protein